jgi:hypothetical protein
VTKGRAAQVFAALLGLAGLGGCLGDIRTSTTPRTATEMLLLSTAAQRAIARVDSSLFAHKHVFLDVSHLATYDVEYVDSAFAHFLSAGGGGLVPDREKADLVVEVRSATLGIWDGKWGVGIPMIYGGPLLPPKDATHAPSLIEIAYALHEGWARFQVWAYDAKTNAFVGSWRDCWGRSYVGFFDDIYPNTSVGDTLQSYTK